MNKKNGAISIYLTIVILSAMLIIGLALSTIMINEIKMSREVSFSAPSYYAAETGIENGLYEVRHSVGPVYNNGSDTGTLDNGATYEVVWDGSSTLTSEGNYENTIRKIEVNW